MDSKIQRAELTHKVQRKVINDLGPTLADFGHPAGLKRTTRSCSGDEASFQSLFSHSRNYLLPLSFYSSLTKVPSFIPQIKYTAVAMSFCFLKWGLIFVLESRNSCTSSACNRSIWDQGLFELLSLVSMRQQDWELRKMNSLFLTARLVTAHPDRSSQKPTNDFYYKRSNLTFSCLYETAEYLKTLAKLLQFNGWIFDNWDNFMIHLIRWSLKLQAMRSSRSQPTNSPWRYNDGSAASAMNFNVHKNPTVDRNWNIFSSIMYSYVASR